MGNRRLTLAAPPFSITAQKLSSSSEMHLNNQLSSSTKKFKVILSLIPNCVSSGDVNEWDNMNIEEWLNAEHFLELKLGRSSSVAIAFPKHLQSKPSVVKRRLNHQQLPQLQQ